LLKSKKWQKVKNIKEISQWKNKLDEGINLFDKHSFYFQNSHLSVGLTQSIETGYHGFANGTTGEGFFRFTVNETVFRLMLLSKDKQNVLKFITFDFLFVGMQVFLNYFTKSKSTEPLHLLIYFSTDKK